LTPFYDLINTTISLSNPVEDIALPLKGKKSKLNKNVLIYYWAAERLRLNKQVIDQAINLIEGKLERWIELINKSFLSKEMKVKYHVLLEKRRRAIW
jgi:serine/threonine-protein kinase HipA